jgi:hypothetical protein
LHLADMSLDAPFATHTWEIDLSAIAGVREFRYFRIIQHGLNSNDNSVLCIGGMELYGKLAASMPEDEQHAEQKEDAVGQAEAS